MNAYPLGCHAPLQAGLPARQVEAKAGPNLILGDDREGDDFT